MSLGFMASYDPQELRKTAHALADAADRITLSAFRQPSLTVENKDDLGFDPVTRADRAAEAAMRDLLAQIRPDDGIIGEEYGVQPGTSGLTWVLDPIDGTRAYIAGAPTWGTLIAVQDQTGPLFGLIAQPYIGERFEGGFGIADLRRGETRTPLRSRPVACLAEATILTTFPEVGTQADGAAFHRLAQHCRLTRYGLDCYGYGLLALGQVDLVVEAGLNAYDIAAPIAVIEAAGGIVTSWEGETAHHGGRVLAAGSADLHAQALQILTEPGS